MRTTRREVFRVLRDEADGEQDRDDHHPTHEHAQRERYRSRQHWLLTVASSTRQHRAQYRYSYSQYLKEVAENYAVDVTENHERTDCDQRRHDRLKQRNERDGESAREHHRIGHTCSVRVEGVPASSKFRSHL